MAPSILLLDIETAPNKVYTWGLYNQNVAINQIEEPGYTLCWAAKWYKSKDMMFSSIHRDGKKKMVKTIHKLIDEADAVIHYNGTRFDIPTLNQEFLSEGLTPPASPIEIDLLRTARRRFRLPSNKLSYVAGYLNLGEKVKHKGMELWRDCMAGDDNAWKIMEKYNKQDVTLLEDIYERLLPWVPNHPNHALFNPSFDSVCPNCGSNHLHKRGYYHTKTLSYQKFQCQNCGAWSRERLTALEADKRRAILVGVA
jgi:DNA polymerase III epsilon subunit-like protein